MATDQRQEAFLRLANQWYEAYDRLASSGAPVEPIFDEIVDTLRQGRQQIENVELGVATRPDDIDDLATRRATPRAPREILEEIESLKTQLAATQQERDEARGERDEARDALYERERQLERVSYSLRMTSERLRQSEDHVLNLSLDSVPHLDTAAKTRASDTVVDALTLSSTLTRAELVKHGERAGHSSGAIDSVLARMRRSGEVVHDPKTSTYRLPDSRTNVVPIAR